MSELVEKGLMIGFGAIVLTLFLSTLVSVFEPVYESQHRLDQDKIWNAMNRLQSLIYAYENGTLECDDENWISTIVIDVPCYVLISEPINANKSTSLMTVDISFRSQKTSLFESKIYFTKNVSFINDSHNPTSYVLIVISMKNPNLEVIFTDD